MSKTTIDIGPDPFEWQTITDLAMNIGVGANAVYMALDEGRSCNGYVLEEREPDDELREELGLDGRTKRVARVVRDDNVGHDGHTALKNAEKRIQDELVRLQVEELIAERDELRTENERLGREASEIRVDLATTKADMDDLREHNAELAQHNAELAQRNAELAQREQVETDDKWLPLIWELAERQHPDPTARCIRALREHYTGGAA